MSTAGPPDQDPAQSEMTADRVENLLRPLVDYDHVVLAVSGGSDSTALMVLASEWRDRRRAEGLPVPIMRVATVDHDLRAGSAEEAASVGRHAERLGLPHTVLIWGGEKPATGLQAAAREARYRLLTAHVATLGAAGQSAVVTGHTRDDQAETVLMRLARGSTVEGLAGMRPRRSLSPSETPCWLVRPFLDVPRSDLRRALEVRGVDWIDDPTNACLDYERPRLRDLSDARDALGLSDAALARSAQRLTDVRDALAWSVSEIIRSGAIDVQPALWASVGIETLRSLPRAIVDRLLLRLVLAFGTAGQTIRLSRIEDLRDRILSAIDTSEAPEVPEAIIGNVVGCLVGVGGGRLWVVREPFRGGAPDNAIRIQPGERATWDNRFVISCDARMPEALTVAALGLVADAAETREALSEVGRPAPPSAVLRGALAAMPTVSLGGKRVWPTRSPGDVILLGESGPNWAILMAGDEIGTVAWPGARHVFR